MSWILFIPSISDFICAAQIDVAVTKLWPQFPDSLSLSALEKGGTRESG